jgi:hypothetical protein
MTPYEEILYEKFAMITCVVAIMLNVCSIGFTLIGAIFGKRSKDRYLIFAGFLLLIINVLIGEIGFLLSIIEPVSGFFAIIAIIALYSIPGIGVTLIIIGAFLKPRKK